MEKQTCALSTSFHVMMLKPVQAEKKINKSAGTDTKQHNMASWCDAYYYKKKKTRINTTI